MIFAENIYKQYGNLTVLKDVSLNVDHGEIVSIVGASGAGKTTLLHILGTLERPEKGSITINNKQPLLLTDKKLATFRNKHIGFVFQFHQLLPEFTAIENVCIPAMIAGHSITEAKKIAMPLLERLGILHRQTHKPNQLSGGEQQRVAVARALINKPSVVLADEPSGNLDTETATQLHNVFFDLRNELQQTFIIVTHNEKLAQLADRTITMKDGYII